LIVDGIRPYEEADETAVAGVWHRSCLDEYTYLSTMQTFTLAEAGWVFSEVILPGARLWVAEAEGGIAGFLALRKSYIDRLYVDPPAQRQGWGARLLAQARVLHPRGLELHTHQENKRARAFYERYGFNAVKFGLSPPPESAPDVEYQWRPDGQRGGK
jgi:ribosomal protein S18 acetylase RimI-like enzyme